MLDVTDVEQLRFTTKMQIFDRKSAKIEAKALAIHIIAFANTDGRHIVIGIEDNGTVTGIDGYEPHINELLRTPFDYCVPSVTVETNILDCVDVNGNPNHILIMHVFQSTQFHANQAGKVYHRVDDNQENEF